MKWLLTLAAVLLGIGVVAAQTVAPPASAPVATAAATSGAATRGVFTLGKDTTRITEPLLEDGRPDYVGYVDRVRGKGVTAGNNVLVGVLEVFGTDGKAETIPPKTHDEALKRLGIQEEQTGTYQRFDQYLKSQGVKYGTALQEDEDLARKHPWGADVYPEIARWLEANGKALDRVVAAAGRERYYWPRIATRDRAAMLAVLLPSLGRMREAANALTMRAMLRLDKGQIKECEADLIAVHRLGRLVSQGPTVIEQLVGVAIETLAARGDVELAEGLKAEAAKVYLVELAKLPGMGDVAVAVDEWERFVMLDAVLSVRKYGWGEMGGIDIAVDGSGEPLEIPEVDISRVDWDKVLKQVNAAYDRVVAAMRKPSFGERQAATAGVEKEMQELRAAALKTTDPTECAAGLMISILMPSLERARELADRAQERTDLGTLAIALAAYRGEKGAYPEKLEALAPGYLKEIPKDIFTNAALTYRKEGAGYVLYSFGPDLKDDRGVAGKNDSTGDMVVRMLK